MGDESGQVVGGRYRLVGRLGPDADARAWRAYDEWLRVDVAVKHVAGADAYGDADRAEVRERTVRQAAVGARLRRAAHVATLYDVVRDGDAVWAVTPLVEGRSLRDHLAAQGSLSVDRAADVARALLTALDAAYAVDVVHRDVKPSNVLLAADGGVLLTDFGTAGGPADPALVGLGVRVGTLGFVAPERIAGAEAGGAGDLFSLGVTLYLALEGRPPFDPADPYGTVSREAPPPRRAGRLAPLLTALLAKDPERRPSAREALTLLDVPSDAVPALVKAPAETVPWPARMSASRLPGPFVLESVGELQDLAFSPDGTVLAGVGGDDLVRLWDLSTARATSGIALSGHSSSVVAVAFSPDGSALASGGFDKTVRIWDASTGAATAELRGHTDWVRTVAFNTDGRVLASAGDDRVIRLWEVSSGALLTTLTGHPGWVRSLAFSPDGRTLAAGAGKDVQLWDVATAQKSASWSGQCGRVRTVRYSPDGRLLAACGRKDGARIWDATSHVPLPAWQGVGGKVRSLAFTPDGTVLATGASPLTVTLWDTDSARQVTSWPGELGAIHAMAFSPDGSTLATTEGKRVRLHRLPEAR